MTMVMMVVMPIVGMMSMLVSMPMSMDMMAVMMLMPMTMSMGMVVAVLTGMGVFVSRVQRHRLAALQIGERGVAIVGATTGGTHSNHLHFFDFEFLARQPFQVAAAARAAPKGLFQGHLAGTLPAAGFARYFNDVQLGPLGDGSLGAQVETKT